MANDRDCENCKHKVNGACNVWDCEFEPCEPVRNPDQLDCVSRKAVLDVVEKAVTKEVARWSIKELPPVTSQKPICPSAGVDCEDCPAYEDAISRKAALDAIEDDARCGVYSHFASYDDAQAFKNYIKDLPSVSSSEKSKSEWQHDHEILKAYSDGASAVLDKVRAEIMNLQTYKMFEGEDAVYVERENVLQIIDEFTAEGSEKE